MAMRFWSSGAHGLSLATFPTVKPSCQRQCHFSIAKASLSTQATSNGFPLVSEESTPVASKERLSRRERAALIESFVQKYMEEHQGAFPNVTTVLKNTGGSRNVVKEILGDLERLYSESTNIMESPIIHTEGDAVQTLEDADEEDEDEAVSELQGEDEDEDEFEDEEAEELTYSGYESEGESGSHEEEDDEEFESTNARAGGKEEAARPSHGESETHSKLSSRLRGMGISNSLQQPSSDAQGSAKRFRPAGMAGSYLPRQGSTENESHRENGRVPEWQTLNYSEKGLRNGTHRGRNGDISKTPPSERHGLFVRYLSCQATSADLREAFEDCGEIVRAYAIKARPNVKYTYGFVDFKTFEALEKALGKERVYIRGTRILTEPSTTAPNAASRKPADYSQYPNAVESGTLHASKRVVNTRVKSYDVKDVTDSGFKVSVMGIPMNVPLSEVQAALSKYGEIVLSDMKQETIGTYSADLEFQDIDAQDRALSAKSVQLHGLNYSITRVNPFKTSVVRLSNIGAVVNIDRIGATCELFGRVKEVVARCDGSIDVYFQSTEVENMPRILTRLNEVTMDGQQWQAVPSSCLDFESYDSLLQTKDGREWLQLESERMLGKVENSLKKLAVDVEDLQEMVKVNRYFMWSRRNGSN